MASSWRTTLLKDLVREITVGHVGPMATEYVDEGIPFLRSLNVDPLRIDTDNIKYITPEFNEKLRKSRLAPGDVVIVRTGKPGSCAVIPDTLPEANCSDLVIVRPSEAINARFLAYYVNAVAHAHVAAHLVGAVQQHFNIGSAKEMPVTHPSVAEQEGVVEVLGSLDEKIELNRQMSRTLEEMAQALFKSWFIDFDPVVYNAVQAGHPIPERFQAAAARYRDDPGLMKLPRHILELFPDRFESIELRHIPGGWRMSSLGEEVKTVLGGTPARKVEAFWGGDIPWINSGKVNEFRIIEPSEYITEEGLRSSAAKLLPRRTTVIAITGATLGQVSLTEIEVAANQSVVGVLGDDTLPNEFLYFGASPFQVGGPIFVVFPDADPGHRNGSR